MSMEKRGVTCRGRVEVVGMSTDDATTICTGCNKIVKGDQIEEGNLCPFCKTEVNFEEKK